MNKVEIAESSMFTADQTFRALRGAAFLMRQVADEGGAGAWQPENLCDIGELLDVLAERGCAATSAGLEAIGEISPSLRVSEVATTN